eukprot:TRINITY_DN4579_c3_g1_i1.p1 TRINITY_DN4579_c3_g1~~TRINITY_DN4579_c3_g1_i1.p1  ORF type:complete len:793 (+),score=112.59 TRINITY_DN4579_c3_g1_i1:61-2379(+)
MRRLARRAAWPAALQRRSCVAKATILGWADDGNVDARLQKVQTNESEGLREVLSKVLQFESATLQAPNSPPPPLRSLPCLSHESVTRLLQELKAGKRIPLMDAMQILSAGSLLFQREPTVVDMTGDVVIVGDLHGSLGDLLHILETHGLPGEPYSYIFNGDLVDRGNNGCEILLLILTLKLSTPDSVHINRGNHEDGRLNTVYGFYDECIAKYNCQFFDYACSLFTWLPLGATVNGHQAFVVHGGLFNASIDDLRNVPRGPNQHSMLTKRQANMVTDLLWADPAEGVQSSAASPRGAGWLFGSEFSIPWLEENGIKYLVRSHQCKSRDGLAINHKGRVFTVFSASNYYWAQWEGVRTMAYPNDGSVLIFEEPKSHENVTVPPGPKDPDQPLQYTWPATLLEADNPLKSAIQHYTGKPFQYSVPNGRLQWDGDLSKFEAEKVIDSIRQRRSTLDLHIKAYDPNDEGIIGVEEFNRMVHEISQLGYNVMQYPENAAFLENGHSAINYKKFFNHHLNTQNRSWRMWHSELLIHYMEYTKNSSLTDMREALREMYPKEFLDDVQIDAFVDQFASHDGVLQFPKGKMTKIEWAEDRRRERLSRMRKIMQDQKVTDDAVQDAISKNSVTDNWITKSGLQKAFKSLGVRVASCFFEDLAEEVGKRRDSLDEPGNIGWLPVDRVLCTLLTETTQEHKSSAALGLSQAFLTVLYNHRHDLSDNNNAGIAVDTFRHALIVLNKLNNFPLTHNQISSLITLIDKDGDGVIHPSELSTVLTQDS